MEKRHVKIFHTPEHGSVQKTTDSIGANKQRITASALFPIALTRMDLVMGVAVLPGRSVRTEVSFLVPGQPIPRRAAGRIVQ